MTETVGEDRRVVFSRLEKLTYTFCRDQVNILSFSVHPFPFFLLTPDSVPKWMCHMLLKGVTGTSCLSSAVGAAAEGTCAGPCAKRHLSPIGHLPSRAQCLHSTVVLSLRPPW